MAENFWKDKRILITGGDGFVGKILTKKICENGGVTFVPEIEKYDLRKEEDVKKVFDESKPEMVIHLAANVGSTSYIKEHASEVYFDNVIMNTLVLEYSRRYQVQKFVGIGSSFEYPPNLEVPFKEEDLFSGDVDPDASSYSLSKRMMFLQGDIYRKKQGLCAIHIIMTSIYGPNQNPNSPIQSMVRRFLDAKLNGKDSVLVWGTGETTRDFLYVDDAAEGILKCAELYNSPEPINIGSGSERKIKDIALMIKESVDYPGRIEFDPTKPEGLKRILLDTTKAQREIGFRPKISFEEGLLKVIDSL